MKFIIKIGNLKIYREDAPLAGATQAFVTLCAYNGADCVGRGTFETALEEVALERLMATFDIYTLAQIRAGIAEITSEFGGELLYGKVAGFRTVEYFKRIDGTRFYKHYLRRPAMPDEPEHQGSAGIEPQRFEIGRTYSMRIPGDHNGEWRYTVTARTVATVKLNDGNETISCLISRSASERNNAETVYPLGRYSKGPELRADHEIIKPEKEIKSEKELNQDER